MSQTTDGITLFNFFEVPEGADKQFVAGWARAREVIDARGGFRWTALHQSLQPQAEFRYVNVAEIASVEAWQAAVMDPEFPRELPGRPHPGLYELTREDPIGEEVESAILINPFEVAEGADDEFLSGWERARDFLREQPGYLGTRLHRNVYSPGEFRYVNRGAFSTAEEFGRAISDPEFPGRSMPYKAHPMLYQIVRR
ncbi:MAG: antibiotic biosynthesis monooxygenase [Solirubrobacterales bacterium]|nr:antibiotic biosynthesis monooxygenase [Solirubrobacterales bacterium]MBV9916052.1 antibiotic biosynthesis monooxygenase [Solirubrobacterales bacterium]